MFLRLPQTVRDECLRGLSLLRRAPASIPAAPVAAVEFAETLADGFPPDAVRARECIDAHVALDRRTVDTGFEDDYGRIVRALWGGDEGRDFARQVLDTPPPRKTSVTQERVTESIVDVTEPEPEPVLVAADLEDDTDEYHDLCVKLNRIDDQTRDRLETAANLAYLTALRALTRQARAAVMASMKKPWREEVGQEIVDARDASRALYQHHSDMPYVAAQFVPAAVMATLTIDQETAITAAIEDLGLTANDILSRAHTDIIRTLAEELDTTEAEIRGELLEQMDEARTDATLLMVGAMTAFTLSRADRTDGDVTEALEAAVIPAVIINDVTVVAGGGIRSGNTVARTADGLIQFADGTTSEVEAPYSSWLYKTTARVLGALPITVMEWSYGSPAERERPRVDHQRLDGTRWTGRQALAGELERLGDAAIVGVDVAPDVWPGSLPGCKCRARVVGLGLPGRVEN